MTTIFTDYGSGGASLTTRADTPGASLRHPPLSRTLRDIADDLTTLKAEMSIGSGNAAVVDITALRTKFIATLTTLDNDGTVNGTDYTSLESPAAITATAILDSSGLVAQLNALIVDVTAFRTKLVATLAKLDLDSGVTDVNYALLWTPAAITATTITTLAEAAACLTKIAADLAAVRAGYVGMLAKLDLDAGVTDTNYASSAAVGALTVGARAALLTIKG